MLSYDTKSLPSSTSSSSSDSSSYTETTDYDNSLPDSNSSFPPSSKASSAPVQQAAVPTGLAGLGKSSQSKTSVRQESPPPTDSSMSTFPDTRRLAAAAQQQRASSSAISAAPKVPARTTLTKAARIGDMRLEVKSREGFSVGMVVDIGTGDQTTRVKITAFGSFVLDRELQANYPIGTQVVDASGASEPFGSPPPTDSSVSVDDRRKSAARAATPGQASAQRVAQEKGEAVHKASAPVQQAAVPTGLAGLGKSSQSKTSVRHESPPPTDSSMSTFPDTRRLAAAAQQQRASSSAISAAPKVPAQEKGEAVRKASAPVQQAAMPTGLAHASRTAFSSGPPSGSKFSTGPPSHAQSSTPDTSPDSSEVLSDGEPEDEPSDPSSLPSDEEDEQSIDDMSQADMISAISDPSHGYSDQYGKSRASSRASRMYGEDTTVEHDADADSEDDDLRVLGTPPKHIVAKKLAAMDLDVGLRTTEGRFNGLYYRAPPTRKASTVLTKAARIGDMRLEIKSRDGFRVGMFVDVGSGNQTTRVKIVGFGSFIIDRPLKFGCAAGTLVVESSEQGITPDHSPAQSHGTPSTEASLSDATPLTWPDEPRTPSSFHYSGAPSPQGSIGGFSVRSQQAGMAKHVPGLFGGQRAHSPRPSILAPKPLSFGSDAAHISMLAIKEGFHLIQGKFECIGEQVFEDDEFEDMYYKYVDPYLHLVVEDMRSLDEAIKMDLGRGGTCIYENPDDPLVCFFVHDHHEHESTNLSFRALTDKALQNFMDDMPPLCFEYPEEDSDQDEDEPSVEEKGEHRRADFKYVEKEFVESDGLRSAEKKHKDARMKRRQVQKKGKGDATEGLEARAAEAGAGPGGRPEGPPPDEEDPFAHIGPPPSPSGMSYFAHTDRPPPPPRTELRAMRIAKTTPSIRRIRLLCRWLDVLRFWPTKMTVARLHTEFCTGLLLLDLVKRLIPAATFVNVNKTALSKQPAVQNLTQALNAIFCSKAVNAARIPTPEDIFSGNVSKITTLVDEIFNVCVRGPLYQQPSLKMLRWYHNLLKAYDLPWPSEILEQGDVSSENQLWKVV